MEYVGSPTREADMGYREEHGDREGVEPGQDRGYIGI